MTSTKRGIRKLTHRQMKAIELWVQDGFKSKAQALRNAGYGESVWRHPDKVFGSPVVQEFMRQEGIREGISFKPLKIEGGGQWGGAYTIKRTGPGEDDFELVKAPKPQPTKGLLLLENGDFEIPNTPLLEVAQYSMPNDPFEVGEPTDEQKRPPSRGGDPFSSM